MPAEIIPDAPQEPPQRFKWRAVRSEDVRALVVGALKEIQSEFMELQTRHWPRGSWNPEPLTTAATALEMGAIYEANIAQAELEVAAHLNDAPGFGEAVGKV